ncbi:MAG: dihydroorotase [Flavobacteriaceae bacterium]
MSILIKSAKIIDASSKFNGKTQDILIIDGKIQEINSEINSKAKKIISLKDLHVSPGWLDTSVCFGEPGLEEREDLINGAQTASFSGFTDIVLNPETEPYLDTKADISYIKSNSKDFVTKIHPLGCLTKEAKSKKLADLFEMFESGAVGFYDFKRPITNSNLIKIALQYVQNFNGLVISFPYEKSLCPNGQMHEGQISTNYGLKGIPTISEEIMLKRDLKILEYTGGKIHIPCISTEESVKLIQEAKKNKLNVTCSVSINNLFFNDDKLKDFDTRFKVLPPIRSEEHRKALIKGLKDGIIDFVTSDHTPIDIDKKKTDFENSLFGSTGLESLYGALNSLFDLNTTIDILTRRKETFGIEKSSINEGQTACLSLFNPNIEYEFLKENIISKSKNSCFIGSKLKGKALGIISNNSIRLIEN